MRKITQAVYLAAVVTGVVGAVAAETISWVTGGNLAQNYTAAWAGLAGFALAGGVVMAIFHPDDWWQHKGPPIPPQP